MQTTTERPRADNAHPNSLAASDDPEIHARINAGRQEFNADQSAMSAWANRGFISGQYKNEDDVAYPDLPDWDRSLDGAGEE